MPQNHVEIKDFAGLFLQQNSFTVPDGAMEDALNCVISQNNVIADRRGYFKFVAADTFNNLFLFQNVLLAICLNKIEWINSSGTPTTLSGAAILVTPPRVSRDVQANNNLYFTSDNGVMKLEAYNGTIYNAGVPPGLDLSGNFDIANGPIGGDTEVAWRVVFGRLDSNKNLLLSAPSDILVLTNRPRTGLSYTSTGGGPYTVTVDTGTPHNLTTNMVVTISNATTASIDGPQTITTPDLTHFTFSVVANPSSGTLDYAVTRSTLLNFSVPDEINSTEYFYQIYRSTQSAGADAVPQEDFRLIDQKNLTSTQISTKVVSYVDQILDIFMGAELYTNPNSQEGELQANERPPLCQDVALFKNFTLYANCSSRQILNFALVSSSVTFINQDDYIEVKEGLTTRRYIARYGVGNSLVFTDDIAGVTTLTVGYPLHGLRVNDTVLITDIIGTLSEGIYTITAVPDANHFTFVAAAGQSAAHIHFEGVADGSGFYIFQLVPPGSSPATGIDSTARGIVKAINRDPSATVYAKYTSGITDIPGKILLQAQGFTAGIINLRASSAQVGKAFSPELPATFDGSVVSDNDTLRNTIYSSKIGEPEAVPIVNNFPIGSRNKAILRIFALRDSVIILKEDGVYRLDGDSTTNFTATIIDSTVICVSASSAAVINNQVVFLSNQGVCMVSGSSVNIISRKIELPIVAILGNPDLNTYTSAVTYESERLYLLTTMSPNTAGASVVYCYNTLTDSWTTWDTFFKQGRVGPENKLFLITEGNTIVKERKNQNKLDYADQDFPATVISVAADKLSAVVNTGSVIPEPGDILVISTTITRIRTVTAVFGDYRLVFEAQTTLKAADTPTLYSSIYTKIRMAPFHAGSVGRSKQISQMQVHTKDASISVLDFTFATESYGSSELTHWRSADVSPIEGWGSSPWGFFPWGLDSGINLTYSTQPAPPIRIYVPLFVQRCTFIQAILEHKAAGEPLNIQSLEFSLRGYGERVSR